MNRFRILGITGLIGALAATNAASAQSSCNNSASSRIASVTVCVDGKQFGNFAVKSDGKIGSIDPTTVLLGGGSSFTLSALFNADPFVNFTFGAIVGVPGSFNFDIYLNTPVIGGPYNVATSTLMSSLSATVPPVAAGSASISQGSYPTYLSGFGDATNLGVDFGTGTCTLSSTSSTTCINGGTANMFAAFSPALLTAHLSFTQTNTGVAVSTSNFSGSVEILATTVPEPSTVILLAAGLFVVGAAAARKRSMNI